MPAVENLAVIPWGSTPSFVKTDNIPSPFGATNELNKSINNLLMDKANKFINQKNQRLSFNSVNDFKSENKKIEEDIVDNILNDFTIEHPQESDHLFYPNTADEINKQSQDEEEQKRRLDIVLNERQCEIEKGKIFDAKKNLLKTLAGIDGNISSSVVYLSDLNIGKMETNVKEHNLIQQFKETTERMIQQNNMDIIAKRLVDNVIKNTVEEVKNEKGSKEKLPSLSEAINENDNSSKKVKSLHKKIRQKIRRSERIAKKILMINKYGKYENRRNKKTTKKPIWKINERFK